MTGSKRCSSDEQVNARTTGQRKEGMRCVLGLRICGTAGAKGLGEVKARIERGVRLFVTCGCGVLVVLCKGQKTSGAVRCVKGWSFGSHHAWCGAVDPGVVGSDHVLSIYSRAS